MSTGVIYARYSCEKQTENSILGQIRECTEFAKKNDIEVINIYKDEAISGRTAEKRPGFMKMISDANQHYFENIIVWKGDRFSRSRADAAKYKSELKKLGIRVLSATEANVTGPEAILMDGINEAFAEYFSVELAAKVERGMTQNCIEGKFNGGRLPIGFKKDEQGHIVLDPQGSEVVRYIFNEYANTTISMKDLAKELDAKGMRNVNGQYFSKSSLSRLLRNRRYLGEYSFKGTVNNNMFPQIVDKITFEKAQQRIRVNRQYRGEFKANEHYLLNGKIFCGECGKPMKSTGGTSKSGFRKKYYTCLGKQQHVCDNPSINKTAIEDVVVQVVQAFLAKESNVDNVIKDIMEYTVKNTPNFDKLTDMIAETDKKIKNYMFALEQGIELDGTVKRLKELQDIKKKQESELEANKKGAGGITPLQYKKFFEHFKDIKIEDPRAKEYLIKTFVNRVIIYKDKNIDVIFKCYENNKPIVYRSESPIKQPSVHQLTFNQRHLL